MSQHSVFAIRNSTLREGWAVLLEMNEYPGGSDLPTNYSDSRKWNATLTTLGWQQNHIFIVNGELTRVVGENALNFLALNADGNDVVIFFIFAHGNYIEGEMDWNNWFPLLWPDIPSQHKLLVVTSCNSENMLVPFCGCTRPHISIASTRTAEYAWAGLPSEGLPIIGEVFNHFLTSAFLNDSADINANDDVSVEEAFAFAAPLSRDYITHTVFPAFPDFKELCNGSAPNPVIDDSYPTELSLRVDYGPPPIDSYFSPRQLAWFPLTSISILSLVVILLVVWWRKKG